MPPTGTESVEAKALIHRPYCITLLSSYQPDCYYCFCRCCIPPGACLTGGRDLVRKRESLGTCYHPAVPDHATTWKHTECIRELTWSRSLGEPLHTNLERQGRRVPRSPTYSITGITDGTLSKHQPATPQRASSYTYMTTALTPWFVRSLRARSADNR